MAILFGVLGTFFGSFLTFLVPRLAQNQKLQLFGRSKAHFSGRTLFWWELIPIFSYLLLKTREHTPDLPKNELKSPRIPLFYPLTELFLGILFFFLAKTTPLEAELAIKLVIATFWTSLMLYDGVYGIVDRRITIPFALFLLFAHIFFQTPFITSFLWAAMAGGAWFFVQWLFSGGKWCGSGDIDLGILLGLTVGLQSLWFHGLLAYYLAFFWFIVLKITKNPVKKLHFGLFLGLSAIIFLLFEHSASNIYWNFIYQPPTELFQ